MAVGQVEQWLIVIGRGGVLGVLVETHLPFVQHAVQVDPRPAVVWESGEVWGGRRSGGGGDGGGEEYREGGGWGEMGGVRKSCRVAVAKLTPHSPDQSRQVGRRDGPAPRREEETHCWTNTDGRTYRQTDVRRWWGMEGCGGRLRTVWVSVCGAYIWLTLEERRGAARSIEEERRKEGEFG